MTEETYTCRHCKKTLPVSSFRKYASTGKRRQTLCFDCDRIDRAVKYREKNGLSLEGFAVMREENPNKEEIDACLTCPYPTCIEDLYSGGGRCVPLKGRKMRRQDGKLVEAKFK